MTILHSGASRKFANNWLAIFSEPKATRGAANKSAGKKSKRPRKQAGVGSAAKRAKKKAPGKKSRK